MLRKLLLALALVLLVSLRASGQGTGADRVSYSYCPRGEQYLYLYDSVSTFNVLANLKCGERVDILGSENGYVIVRTADGKQGYVPLDGITSTPPAKARAAREAATGRLPQPAVVETSARTVKAPTAWESATSRLPEPAVVDTPKPPAKTLRAAGPTSIPSPPPVPVETPTLLAKAPTSPTTIPSPQPVPVETAKPPAKELRAAGPTRIPSPPPVPVEAPTSPVKAPTTPTTIPSPQPAPVATPAPPAKTLRAAGPTSIPSPPPASVETAIPPVTPITPEPPILRRPRRIPSGTSALVPEIFGGYSFLSFDTNKLSSRQTFNGWESSVALHVNNWLAGEGSISGYYKTYAFDLTSLGLSQLKTSVHDLDFLGGPRIDFQPMFFHVLLGIEHLTATGTGYSASENSFAAGFGGGGQWRINRQWAVRASADYLVTRHNLLNAQTPITQNNIRISGGVVYTFRPRTE